MKQLRLIALVLAASAFCAAIAFACGGAKSATASNASCCSGGATATAANAKGAKGAKVANGAQCTPEMQAACTPEMRAACTANKSAGAAGCSMHGASAAAGCAGGSMAAHMDCAVCSDQMECEEDLRTSGAHTQVVALKNGAMIVYTAETPESVRALQATVARHNAAVVSVLNGQRDGKLCSQCKPLRGAMASGKLTREVVNVQRGSQIIITSSDRAMVQRIHDMTGAQLAARVRD